MNESVREAAEKLVGFIKHNEFPEVGSDGFVQLTALIDAVDTALRAALEREEQEPVAWINRFENHDGLSFFETEDTPFCKAGKFQQSIPLYTSPQPTRKLTDDSWITWYKDGYAESATEQELIITLAFIRAIAAKLNETNEGEKG